jgi:hypothetical protein
LIFHAVDNSQNSSVTSTAAAMNARLNVQMGQSLPQVLPSADVEEACAADVNGADSFLGNNQVIAVTSLKGAAAATAVQRNRIKERRQLNDAAPASAQQNETLIFHAVDNSQNSSVTSTAAAMNARLNVQMGQSLPQVLPSADVEEACAADVNGTSTAVKSRFCPHTEHFELEEIVVQATCP